LSCEIDEPQFGTARFDTTRVVKVNHPKTTVVKRDPTVYGDHLSTLSVLIYCNRNEDGPVYSCRTEIIPTPPLMSHDPTLCIVRG